MNRIVFFTLLLLVSIAAGYIVKRDEPVYGTVRNSPTINENTWKAYSKDEDELEATRPTIYGKSRQLSITTWKTKEGDRKWEQDN
ncbi:hypothetical protein PV327_002104 [Microctonus hyperodae]|uniref:Uncharacterized protein n=1 Tax=Microctonus hyperodae TaxID=165561 RepID=A0AA39KNR3_MICHY|nr:hypothetical protein PV327_002104 [Microctonus hyperodae]